MSRIAYLDCASGASGDMLLGAIVDLGLPLSSLRDGLRALPLDGYRLEERKVDRSGLRCTKVDVVVDEKPAHHDRRLASILQLLDRSGLEADIRQRAAGLFRRLAEAEASVHGTRPEDVHFHEVGAVDAIVDVVGGVIGLAWLQADRVVASPLNLGTGSVTMAHGSFPVPAPATARLVQGAPVYGDGEGELLTPTGALLITGHADGYGPLPLLRLEKIGHGAGTRDTPGRPNALRILVGEEARAQSGRVLVLEAEVDDMSPQLAGPLLERLLAEGALDAYLTPVSMKKGRPGLLISVLAPPDRREALEGVLFAETTTLGVRRHECERSILDRSIVRVTTAYGTIEVKEGRQGGRLLNAQPEFESCLAAARSHGVPAKEVWAAALAAYRSTHSEER